MNNLKADMKADMATNMNNMKADMTRLEEKIRSSRLKSKCQQSERDVKTIER